MEKSWRAFFFPRPVIWPLALTPRSPTSRALEACHSIFHAMYDTVKITILPAAFTGLVFHYLEV